VLLKKVIGPYSRARIPFLAKKINCDEREVERLLASLIMDGRIDGHIDQVNQLLVLSRKRDACEGGSVNKYAQLEKICQTVGSMQKNLLQKANV
jgi:COP9 signalosome complex subunit 2